MKQRLLSLLSCATVSRFSYPSSRPWQLRLRAKAYVQPNAKTNIPPIVFTQAKTNPDLIGLGAGSWC